MDQPDAKIFVCASSKSFFILQYELCLVISNRPDERRLRVRRELVVVRRCETAERVPDEEKPQLAGDIVLPSLSHLAVVPEHALVDVSVTVIIVEGSKDLHPERARGLGDVAVLQSSVSICD